MEDRSAIRFMPLGGILDRYLVRTFLRVFLMSLAGVTAVYLIVEFFDRVDTFVDNSASPWLVARYFFYKSPLLIARIIGFATLFSTLFCLGMLSRTQEITAMRASGLSIQRIALPLLLLSLVVCGLNFVWNEALVPIFERRAQTIYRTEVKGQQQKSLFGTNDIWMRGAGNFINVDTFDARTNTLQGVTVFLLGRDFSLRGTIEIPQAHWNGSQWQADGASEWHIGADGEIVRQQTAGALPITETPEELQLLARDAEEFTFWDLQKQIVEMKNKGIDSTEYEVDLQSKLAFPLIPALMVLLGVPFAIKRRLGGGLALSFGIAMLIAFGYWVLAAFCTSLGHSAALPVTVAAWLPNTVFALVGVYFFSAEQ